ncbi:hypothetical protein J3459_022390 [Metarhizium acridum]|nr:hypothetical protein J3459_022390 [Metarhizium acridum]
MGPKDRQKSFNDATLFVSAAFPRKDAEFAQILNNACQRYLIETNGYNDLVVLLEVNAMAMPTIPPQPSSIQIELEGDLVSPRGQALARVGRAEEGVKQVKLSVWYLCQRSATQPPRRGMVCRKPRRRHRVDAQLSGGAQDTGLIGPRTTVRIRRNGLRY